MACQTAVASYAGMNALGGAIAGKGLANKGGGVASDIGGLASSGGASALAKVKSVTSKIANVPGLAALPGGKLANVTSGVLTMGLCFP